MPQDVQVSCINKPDRNNHHERIQNIGGVNPNGSHWRLTEDEAILGIEQGKWTFFTSVGGYRANVVIAHHALLGRKYLTTTPDDYRKNNLLALPECPPQ